MYNLLIKMATGTMPVNMRTPVSPEGVQILVHEFMRVVVGTFSDHWKKGLFTLNLNVLHYMAEYINCFGRPHLLDASSFENFKLTINQTYRTTSLRHGTIKSDTVRNIDKLMKRGSTAAETARSTRGPSFAYRTLRLSESGNLLFGCFFTVFEPQVPWMM